MRFEAVCLRHLSQHTCKPSAFVLDVLAAVAPQMSPGNHFNESRATERILSHSSNLMNAQGYLHMLWPLQTPHVTLTRRDYNALWTWKLAPVNEAVATNP